MKTMFLTLLLFVTSITITAQEATPIKKWSFGAEIFPNSTYEIITNDGTAVGEELYREIEVAKLCISGQVYASYNLNSKSSISIGLGYQNTGNQTKFKQLSFSDRIDSRRGFVYDSTSSNSSQVLTYPKFVYNHHNIQIPIFYKYNFTNRFYARSGISSIFNFSNTTTSVMKTSDKTTRNRENDNLNYRSINFSGNLGIGYSYFKSSTLDLYVQANVETSFMQLSKNVPLNRRPVSIGLIFGARI
jgi:hypothetical protein